MSRDPRVDPIHEALLDRACNLPCMATTTEFNGERMSCILISGHVEAHTDGCCAWNDPWGEIDADLHAAHRGAHEDE